MIQTTAAPAAESRWMMAASPGIRGISADAPTRHPSE
jgi:hypothetical protein